MVRVYCLTDGVHFSIQSTIYGNLYARDINGYLALPRANNLNHFESAIHLLDTSYYNFGFMDNLGNIAFYESGEIPIRKDLADGKIVSPPFFVKDSALDAKNGWIPLKNTPADQSLPYKIIPFANMPHVTNPSQGFFVNSNNDPVGLTLNNLPLSNNYLPNGGIYYLGFKQATGERAEQITRLIQAKFKKNQKISLKDMKAIQTNTQSLLAEQFVPYILKAFAHAKSKDPEMIEAIHRLRQWDFTTSEHQVAATIFYLWQSYFLANTVEKTLSEHHLPLVTYPIATQTMLHLLKTFNKTFGIGSSGINFFSVKNIHNPKHARDYIIINSLHEALEKLKSPEFAKAFASSKNQDDYHWGKLHRVIFKNILGQNIPPSGSIARDGGIETINAANFNGLATKPDDFIFSSGASLRRVIEIRPNGVISFVSLPGGESEEEKSPFFTNMLNKWLQGKYYQEK
ncbi:MAG: penicillin acylase family protein [Legionella sp.]|nr:penicillin acylase family protein [Legionella sp.]